MPEVGAVTRGPIVRYLADGRALVDRASLATLTGRSPHTIRARCPIAGHADDGRALYDAEQCAATLATIPTRKRRPQLTPPRHNRDHPRRHPRHPRTAPCPPFPSPPAYIFRILLLMGHRQDDSHERHREDDAPDKIGINNEISGGHFEGPVGQFGHVYGNVNLNPPKSPEEAAFRARYMAKMQEEWDAEERLQAEQERRKAEQEEIAHRRITALLVVLATLVGIVAISVAIDLAIN
ncbi:hypothetical protein [Saccharopolyspora sp. 5N708]|uniref:hypothetical protein n=1 Tax=Saccharopolyspora sp. 5N708 TaxID=3457424 RepID=UPI003FD3D83D